MTKEEILKIREQIKKNLTEGEEPYFSLESGKARFYNITWEDIMDVIDEALEQVVKEQGEIKEQQQIK